MIFWFLSLKVFHCLIHEALVLLLDQTCQSFCENLGSDRGLILQIRSCLLLSFCYASAMKGYDFLRTKP